MVCLQRREEEEKREEKKRGEVEIDSTAITDGQESRSPSAGRSRKRRELEPRLHYGRGSGSHATRARPSVRPLCSASGWAGWGWLGLAGTG